MQRLILVATLALTTLPHGAYAQELDRIVDRFGGAPMAMPTLRHSVEMPDSVKQKVGYHHWKGAAIGGGVGAVAGLALALAVRGVCADCGSDPNLAETSLTVAGLGAALGFLVGLASPKYVMVPRRD